MLISILNCCTQEELEEVDEEEEEAAVEDDEELGERSFALPLPRPTVSDPSCALADENGDNRSAIKSKILAVGRMSRVFALLREEAESGSELKSIDGTTALSNDTLNNGAEEVKVGIKDFRGARTSDIENERLPPEMIDVRTYILTSKGMPTDRPFLFCFRPTRRRPLPLRTRSPTLPSPRSPNLLPSSTVTSLGRPLSLPWTLPRRLQVPMGPTLLPPARPLDRPGRPTLLSDPTVPGGLGTEESRVSERPRRVPRPEGGAWRARSR